MFYFVMDSGKAAEIVAKGETFEDTFEKAFDRFAEDLKYPHLAEVASNREQFERGVTVSIKDGSETHTWWCTTDLSNPYTKFSDHALASVIFDDRMSLFQASKLFTSDFQDQMQVRKWVGSMRDMLFKASVSAETKETFALGFVRILKRIF